MSFSTYKLITDLKISRTVANLLQRAKKVVSDSAGLVDFAIGLVIFVLNLPDGQVQFFGEIQITEGWLSILLIKKVLGLVEMTCGLVHASYSLPEWQAVKLTFFAPCLLFEKFCLMTCYYFSLQWVFL